jgi:hypothetical protein
MKARWLLNALLLAIIIGLALVAVYRPGKEQPPAPTRLTSLPVEQVTRINIQRDGGEELTLEKQGDRWRLTAPFAARANAFRVNALAQLVSTNSDKRFTAPAAELEKYGLRQPIARLRLNEQEFLFGSRHPITGRRYIYHAGQVHLITDTFSQHARAAATDFIDLKLIAAGQEPVRIQLPEFSVFLQDGKWTVQPEQAGLAADDISAFADHWKYARALSATPHQAGEGGRPLVLTIRDGGQQQAIEMEIFSDTDGVVVYRPDEGLDYQLPEDAGNRLLRIQPE